MKTILQFVEQSTGSRSSCGDPLEIELSSRDLGWGGILLEKGWSPHFFPSNIITPYFYFALAIEERFKWSAESRGELIDLKTEPGEIWMNPPNIPFTHIINDPCHFIIFTIDEKTLLAHFEGMLPEQELQFLQNYNVADPSLEYFVRLFCNEASIRGRNGIQYLQGLIKLFSTYYIRNYSNYADLVSKKGPSPRIHDGDIGSITRFIRENIERTIAIEDLAEICRLSKFYFLKEFKKHTGITPYQYILKVKLERSKELLREPGIQIIDVAYKLGFSDQSHFANAFKKHFGYPPGAYKSSE